MVTAVMSSSAVMSVTISLSSACENHLATSNGNSNYCPLGRYSTGEIGDDSFTFRIPIASGVPNPMTFTGSVWPISCSLLLL